MSHVTTPEGFWSRGERSPAGCLEWTGSVGSHGYGEVRVMGRRVLVHRYAYELANGGEPVARGLVVCHRCDNKRCIEPTHLFIGTQADNLADMVRKGRSARGERNGLAVLTAEIVADARRRVANGERASDIADELGLRSRSALYQAVRGDCWTHVATPPVKVWTKRGGVS